MFVDMMKKAQDVSRNEIKYVKKIFYWLDKAIECMEKRDAEILSEEERGELNNDIERYTRNVYAPLRSLYAYEVTYESFEKYAEDSRYGELVKKAHDRRPEGIALDGETFFRLKKNHFVTKRSAKKDFEDYVKGIKNEKNLVFRIIFSKVLNEKAEEAVYKLRDFLVNDFDELIDKIEPLRQEYIISRKGNVKYEEVNEYLAPIVESYDVDYDFYELFLIHRTNSPFVYHPDLKF